MWGILSFLHRKCPTHDQAGSRALRHSSDDRHTIADEQALRSSIQVGRT